jgi:lysophospholipase L1-like esterase
MHSIAQSRWLLAVVSLMLALSTTRAQAPYWVEPMKKVHAQFKGEKGTFAQFGDSITVTMAFWAPLAGEPKNAPPELARAHELVKKYMKPDCWSKWKGGGFGSNGGMTIRWAHDNIDKWLEKLNPEVAVIMFGTNDLGPLELKEYEQKYREVVDKCLKNGTVVILTTIPPRTGRLDKARTFAEAVQRIGKDMGVPVIDYFGECLKRRPDDWDGTLAKFKDTPGGVYEVPTVVSGDGVHPSNPSKFRDYSEESLKSNGYLLRNYLTLLMYADVIRQVLQK